MEYRHCRVVFGVSSSPFLLAATINYHLDLMKTEFVSTAKRLKESLYVDNSIISLESEDEVQRYIKESTLIMSRAKMDLRGWTWNTVEENSGEVTGIGGLGSSPCGLETDRVEDEYQYKEAETVSVLGYLWNTNTNRLGLDMKDFNRQNEATVTKRRILSVAHNIFDPLGFFSPVTFVPRMLLQEVWTLKLGWDEAVSQDIARKFNRWIREVDKLRQISIPRWMLRSHSEDHISLHIFADASQKAYAGCAFLRSQDCSGVSVQLVMAKSRVAPTKKITIPRLELLSCCIATRMAANVIEIMGYSNISTHYWTDSSNVLHWIQKNENWATFVWNRVQEIRNVSDPNNWTHIPGDVNPADLPSRGSSPNQLLQSKWWEGPRWLKLSENHWPKSEVQCDQQIVNAERKKVVICNLATKRTTLWYSQYFSSYRKTVRSIAWVLRFVNCLTNAKTGEINRLSIEEEQSAELVLLKTVQENVFKVGGTVLKQLNAVKCEDGIWRVMTRSMLREDLHNFKYPILLPFNNVIVDRLIVEEHIKMNHCGIQVLMRVLRERFWVIKSRRAIRRVILMCGRCRRFSVKNVVPVEGPLPINRVRDATTFEVTGVDLGGPLYLKNRVKSWFVVFTCAVYRAVHLELLTSLSTEAFLQTLR